MAATARRTLHLNAVLPGVGQHGTEWRLPAVDALAHVDIAHYQELARIAERGRFDSVFLADSPVLWSDLGQRVAGTLEPTVLLTALAAVTEHVGLITTASTAHSQPYALARRFASLDQVSGGRAGWSIVTTADPRIGRTREPATSPAPFRLALSASRTPRSPQGHPLLVRCDSAGDDRNLTARYAEVVFTAHRHIEEARAYYVDLKRRAMGHGRHPDSVRILPGLVPVIGASEAEAQELAAESAPFIQPEYALPQLADLLGVSADELRLDRELPAELAANQRIEEAKSRRTLVINLARRERLTVRELIGRLGGGRGHLTVAGTPERIADTIAEWHRAGAADGFSVMPPVLPSGLSAFVDHVVPILQRRGLFRTEYAGRTLRDTYDLRRPGDRSPGPLPLLAA